MRCRAAGSTLSPLLKEAQTHPAQIELLQPGPTGKKGHGTQGKQAQLLLHWQRPRGARRHPPLHLQEQSLALEGAGQETSGPTPLAPFGLKSWPTSHTLQAAPAIHLSQTAIAW